MVLGVWLCIVITRFTHRLCNISTCGWMSDLVLDNVMRVQAVMVAVEKRSRALCGADLSRWTVKLYA